MKFKIVEGPEGQQGTPEWHAFRKDKIGSSDAAPIMGVGFSSPLQLWESKVFNKKKFVNKAMKRGSDMEAKARAWVNAKMKFDYQPAVIQSIEHPDLIASLDGFFIAGVTPWLLEIKCPGPQDHQIAVGGLIPSHYFAQLQHQMMVADAQEMFYCSFDGEDGVMILCYRDDVFCAKLLRQELAFIQRIIDFDPPKPVEADWPEIIDPVKSERVERLRELDLLWDEIGTERLSIREELKRGVEHPRFRIGNLHIEKRLSKGRVDYSAIEQLKGVNLENYRKAPIESWHFTF